MDNQKLIFRNLKNIKDHFAETSVKSLDPEMDLIWTSFEEEYRLLQNIINTPERKVAYEKVLHEVLEGAIFSILVMFDGGDDLGKYLKIDIIEQETKKTLNPNKALHEEFIDYLSDVES